MNNKKIDDFIVWKERITQNYTWMICLIGYVFVVITLSYFIKDYLPTTSLPFLNSIVKIFYYVLTCILLLIGITVVIKNANYTPEIRLKENAFRLAGIVNAYGEPPSILKIEKRGQGFVYHIYSAFLPVEAFENNKGKIENAWNVQIRDIVSTTDQKHIAIKVVENHCSNSQKLHWDNDYLSNEDFIIKLGQDDFGNEVSIDLGHLPHVLLASATGGGKTYLLNLMLLQSWNKQADVKIVDMKGGMDYQNWFDKCPVITTAEACLECLNALDVIIEERKQLLIDAKVSNIKEYNAKLNATLPRIIVVFDEVADVLGVKKKNKEDKELFSRIEDKIGKLTRTGRAFGVHCILCYQRPSSEALSGDIKANLGIRICGRADKIMSQMVLDSDDAAEMIKPDAEGLFVTNMGGLFKAYYWDIHNESKNEQLNEP